MAENPDYDKSMETIYQVAGESLSKVLDLTIDCYYYLNKEEFIHWWYNPNNKGLGKSPDELCKEGESGRKRLENILMDIFMGNGGG